MRVVRAWSPSEDLFTDMEPFRIPGRLFLLQRAWLRHSLDFGKRANPPLPRNSVIPVKRSSVGLLATFGRTVMHPGPRCSTGTRQLESGAWKWPLDFKIQNSSRFIFFLFTTPGCTPSTRGV